MKENNSETYNSCRCPIVCLERTIRSNRDCYTCWENRDSIFIEYENELYAITATHCLDQIPLQSIFISLY